MSSLYWFLLKKSLKLDAYRFFTTAKVVNRLPEPSMKNMPLKNGTWSKNIHISYKWSNTLHCIQLGYKIFVFVYHIIAYEHLISNIREEALGYNKIGTERHIERSFYTDHISTQILHSQQSMAALFRCQLIQFTFWVSV